MEGHAIGVEISGLAPRFRTGHHLAGVQATANRKPVALAPQRIADRQCRLAGANCVVFLRPWSAEQRYHTVAERLQYRAAGPLYRLAHHPQRLLQQQHRRLGVEPSHKLGRAYQVDEERGNKLQLTFLDEDTPRYGAWPVRLHAGAGAKRRSAGPAKGGACLAPLAATQTDRREPRAAALAETVVRRVIRAAGITLHGIVRRLMSWRRHWKGISS